MIPQCFYIPSADATKDQIILRMHQLAEEHDMTVILVRDFGVTNQRLKPKPKSLFLKKGGVRVPKYMDVRYEKDPHGHDTPVITIEGHFFSLPNRLLGETHHFGILVDESKTEDTSRELGDKDDPTDLHIIVPLNKDGNIDEKRPPAIVTSFCFVRQNGGSTITTGRSRKTKPNQ